MFLKLYLLYLRVKKGYYRLKDTLKKFIGEKLGILYFTKKFGETCLSKIRNSLRVQKKFV